MHRNIPLLHFQSFSESALSFLKLSLFDKRSKEVLNGLGSDRRTKYSSPPIKCSSTMESGRVCVIVVVVIVVVDVVIVDVEEVVGLAVETMVLVRLSQLKLEPFVRIEPKTMDQNRKTGPGLSEVWLLKLNR